MLGAAAISTVAMLSTLLWIAPSLTARNPAGSIGLAVAPDLGMPPGWRDLQTAVTGLNTRFNPVVSVADVKGHWEYGVEMENSSGSGGKGDRGELGDDFGNHVFISPLASGGVHLADSLGGYADVRWDGNKWVLLASRYGGQTGTALGPTEHGKTLLRMAGYLQGLGIVAVMLSVAVTLVINDVHAANRPSLSGVATFLLSLGLLGLTYSAIDGISNPFRGGEAAMSSSILAFLFMLPAIGGWLLLVLTAWNEDLSKAALPARRSSGRR
jgi:hypothetical protein